MLLRFFIIIIRKSKIVNRNLNRFWLKVAIITCKSSFTTSFWYQQFSKILGTNNPTHF
jgi:hypothetical protein